MAADAEQMSRILIYRRDYGCQAKYLTLTTSSVYDDFVLFTEEVEDARPDCAPENADGVDHTSRGDAADSGFRAFSLLLCKASVAKCGLSWGKAAPGSVTLYTPEVKML